MKKFRSLVLTLVMTMSLVTVNADTEDFNNNSSIESPRLYPELTPTLHT